VILLISYHFYDVLFSLIFPRYVLIIVLILSAIITPPDVISQVIVAIPIMILYEISILISAVVVRKEVKQSTLK
jgi:sec-independent protein translocase protein TatC